MQAPSYQLDILTAKQFTDMQVPWQTLLANADADPLFLSWHWVYHWWQVFGQCPGDRLAIVIARQADGQLLGIAPLYLATAPGPGGRAVRTLQFLGTRYRGASGFRSECLEYIIHRQHPGLADAFNHYIRRTLPCDLFYLADLISDSVTAHSLQKCFPYRQQDPENTTYSIATHGSFDSYIATLGKNTRLRAFNRRKLLEAEMDVSVNRNSAATIAAVFATLNTYHAERWNNTVDAERQQRFITQLTEAGAIQFDGVIIRTATRTLAATLDLVAGKRRYNIQLGFDPAYHKKLSLGLLALTYCTEHCFTGPTEFYDLLTGTGKNTDYKAHIAAVERRFASVYIPRSLWLQLWYRSKALARKLLQRQP